VVPERGVDQQILDTERVLHCRQKVELVQHRLWRQRGRTGEILFGARHAASRVGHSGQPRVG
jgi:hypothetical protein